jgi:hypothetical protein
MRRWQTPFRQVSLAVAIGLYAVSFILPAFRNLQRDPEQFPPAFGGEIAYGYQVFGSGYFYARMFFLPWYANLAFLIGLLSLVLRKPKLTAGFGSLALVLGMAVPAMLSGYTVPEFHVGYYIWLGSFASLTIAGLVLTYTHSAAAGEAQSEVVHP